MQPLPVCQGAAYINWFLALPVGILGKLLHAMPEREVHMVSATNDLWPEPALLYLSTEIVHRCLPCLGHKIMADSMQASLRARKPFLVPI